MFPATCIRRSKEPTSGSLLLESVRGLTNSEIFAAASSNLFLEPFCVGTVAAVYMAWVRTDHSVRERSRKSSAYLRRLIAVVIWRSRRIVSPRIRSSSHPYSEEMRSKARATDPTMPSGSMLW